ncbi:hypothetical protein ZWY2020_034040 [Hordeum vulgare]|nr:hypothetical protein ZWY2020_034040 [Hordeum vulgare]
MMRPILPPGVPVPEEAPNLDCSIVLASGSAVPSTSRGRPVEILGDPKRSCVRTPHPGSRGAVVEQSASPCPRSPVSGSMGREQRRQLGVRQLGAAERVVRQRGRRLPVTVAGPGEPGREEGPVVTFRFTPDSKYGGSDDDMSEQYEPVTKEEKRRRRRRMACNRCGKRKWESEEAAHAAPVCMTLVSEDDGVDARRPQVRHLYHGVDRRVQEVQACEELEDTHTFAQPTGSKADFES